VEKALKYEEKRLTDSYPNWNKGKVTRGFNSTTGETYEQRHKEEAADYRYFPEPDLPPIETKELILEAKSKLVKTNTERFTALKSRSFNLTDAESQVVVKNKNLSKIVSKYLNEPWAGGLVKLLVHNPELIDKDQQLLINYAEAIEKGEISVSLARQKIVAGEIFNKDQLSDFSDDSIRELVKKVIAENQEAVIKYQSGNNNLLGFFVGQVMRQVKGQVEPKLINQIILEELKNGN
jgi:aspartyl-tRNA(Asn)/glutamyl-tRNA(Gln) amidotransferase subunit B